MKGTSDPIPDDKKWESVRPNKKYFQEDLKKYDPFWLYDNSEVTGSWSDSGGNETAPDSQEQRISDLPSLCDPNSPLSIDETHFSGLDTSLVLKKDHQHQFHQVNHVPSCTGSMLSEDHLIMKILLCAVEQENRNQQSTDVHDMNGHFMGTFQSACVNPGVYSIAACCISSVAGNCWYSRVHVDVSDTAQLEVQKQQQQGKDEQKSNDQDQDINVVLEFPQKDDHSNLQLYFHRRASDETWWINKMVFIASPGFFVPQIQNEEEIAAVNELKDASDGWAVAAKQLRDARHAAQSFPKNSAWHKSTVALACSQSGSKQLQAALDTVRLGSPHTEAVKALWIRLGVSSAGALLSELADAVQSDFMRLSTNLFGNYFVQHMLPLLTVAQRVALQQTREFDFLALAKDRQGTRVLQTLIAVATSPLEHVQLLSKQHNNDVTSLYDFVLSHSDASSLDTIQFDFDSSVNSSPFLLAERQEVQDSQLCLDPHFSDCSTVQLGSITGLYAAYRHPNALKMLGVLCSDTQAWYAVLAIIKHVPLKLLVLSGVANWLFEHIPRLARSAYGVVLQKQLFVVLPPRPYQQAAFVAVRASQALASDAYGNYLLQLIVERNSGILDVIAPQPFLALPASTRALYEAVNRTLYMQLTGSLFTLATRPYSCNLVICIITAGAPILASAVVSELLWEHLLDVLLCETSNNLLRTILHSLNENQLELICSQVSSQINSNTIPVWAVRRWEYLLYSRKSSIYTWSSYATEKKKK